ncbi:MAG: 50S ribosomal protein L15 [Candidatus Aenigmarchaeota archaeon]|nr:50S ribosomal protein L15 [Candidatus Aenigmarchaeota archaeon]NIQ18095.1 50S ribosomal protein L15 [Candidatus Aenigmarchaeota archaeon]
MARKTKTEKKRGTRTLGRGGIKKCRGKGHRGGKGYSGSKKHRKSWVLRYERGHIGKPKGFISKTSKSVKSINLRDLENLAKDKKEIVLKDLGYDKVLGSGNITKKLVVRAKTFSKHAKEKIEKAGGKAIAE